MSGLFLLGVGWGGGRAWHRRFQCLSFSCSELRLILWLGSLSGGRTCMSSVMLSITLTSVLDALSVPRAWSIMFATHGQHSLPSPSHKLGTLQEAPCCMSWAYVAQHTHTIRACVEAGPMVAPTSWWPEDLLYWATTCSFVPHGHATIPVAMTVAMLPSPCVSLHSAIFILARTNT